MAQGQRMRFIIPSHLSPCDGFQGRPFCMEGRPKRAVNNVRATHIPYKMPKKFSKLYAQERRLSRAVAGTLAFQPGDHVLKFPSRREFFSPLTWAFNV